MLKKNARLEIMYQHGFRPSHAVWIDTYNKQFGGGIIYTIQTKGRSDVGQLTLHPSSSPYSP